MFHNLLKDALGPTSKSINKIDRVPATLWTESTEQENKTYL